MGAWLQQFLPPFWSLAKESLQLNTLSWKNKLQHLTFPSLSPSTSPLHSEPAACTGSSSGVFATKAHRCPQWWQAAWHPIMLRGTTAHHALQWHESALSSLPQTTHAAGKTLLMSKATLTLSLQNGISRSPHESTVHQADTCRSEWPKTQGKRENFMNPLRPDTTIPAPAAHEVGGGRQGRKPPSNQQRESLTELVPAGGPKKLERFQGGHDMF